VKRGPNHVRVTYLGGGVEEFSCEYDVYIAFDGERDLVIIGSALQHNLEVQWSLVSLIQSEGRVQLRPVPRL